MFWYLQAIVRHISLKLHAVSGHMALEQNETKA
jgi:hypothetical protein